MSCLNEDETHNVLMAQCSWLLCETQATYLKATQNSTSNFSQWVTWANLGAIYIQWPKEMFRTPKWMAVTIFILSKFIYESKYWEHKWFYFFRCQRKCGKLTFCSASKQKNMKTRGEWGRKYVTDVTVHATEHCTSQTFSVFPTFPTQKLEVTVWWFWHLKVRCHD